MIISLDTETTGVDLAHGAMPFLVTTCDDDGAVRYWEWRVDPLTRLPEIPDGDLADITELVGAADLVYLHNAKFDADASAKVGVDLPWSKVRDTLDASHLLASNHRHDLTALCVEYLGADIEPLELSVKEVTQVCRSVAKREYPAWRLADEGVPGMPSVKSSSKRDEDKPWKNDMWLPRALVKAGTSQYLLEHYATACSDYANGDSEHTLFLGLELERLLRERNLWAIYEHRLQLVRADYEMERYGITVRGDYTDDTVREYEQHVAEAEAEMVAIAAGYGHDLELAAGAALNDNMRGFFYGSIRLNCTQCRYEKTVKHWNGEGADAGHPKYAPVCPKCASRKRNPQQHRLIVTRRDNLSLTVIGSKKTGNASLDGEVMREYLATLDEGPALDFVELLADKRAYDTAISYMRAYQRYWLPELEHPGYYRIHAHFNPCGTDHLRQSSNSPNMQNVSGDSKELSNRACFGPLPGREWWRMDYKSIESRIPAYESGEPKLIELFDRPNEPPYFGSTYNLVASIFYPSKYGAHATVNGAFKKHEPGLYKRAKFFWLARQYGAGKRKGDRLAGFDGASDLVESDLPRLAALQLHYLRLAERTGYVETLPDRSVDPKRGYPILASRTEDGRVLSTTPFNYHVSGTACWVKNLAIVRCTNQCEGWQEDGFDADVCLEVHDELLFDFPRGASMEENLPRALVLKGIMEEQGGNLVPPIPTPVSLSYHVDSWAEGVDVSV